MEITILGSGTGVPNLNRNASGVLVKVDGVYLLFDTGPGIMRKLLEVGLSYHDINYIFYTHLHTDHTLELASFLFAAKYSLSLRVARLDIIGPNGTQQFYDGLISLYGEVIRPQAYQLQLREIDEGEFKIDNCTIITRRLEHTPQSLGYRIELNNKVLVYSGDTDVCDNIVELAKGADVLILDCSFPNQMKAKGHLIPKEAAWIAKKCNCQKLILSHLYPVCDQEEIYQQARREFDKDIVVATDLMKFSL